MIRVRVRVRIRIRDRVRIRCIEYKGHKTEHQEYWKVSQMIGIIRVSIRVRVLLKAD